jgi:protein-S-isoprenylcysteine O-methyltransferase Ste14
MSRRGGLVLLLVACAVLTLRLGRELGVGRGPVGAAAIALLIVWLLLEAPLAARVASDDARGEDRGTVRLNAIARAAAVAVALLVPVQVGEVGLRVSGLLLFVSGFAFRLAAIRQLGRFYSHKVRRADGHRVIDSGPYRVVRHPAYLGVIAAHVGFALVFGSVYSVAAVLLLVVPAFVWRIRVEEPVLMSIPGYAEYASSHARLVPGIW